LLAASCKPLREPPHERQVLLDQAVARGLIAVLVVAPEELAGSRAPRDTVGGQRNQFGRLAGGCVGRPWTPGVRRRRPPRKRLWGVDQRARSRPRDRRQGVRTRLGRKSVSGLNLRHARSPIPRARNGNRFHISYPVFVRASTSFTRRSGLIQRGLGYLRIITRVSRRLCRNSTKVAAAALLYFAIAPGAGAADGSSLTSLTDPATQASPAELQAQIADASTNAPELPVSPAESASPATEAPPPATPAAEPPAPAVDPTEAAPPPTVATLHPDVAPLAAAVKENSGHEFTRSSLKEAVSLGSHSVIPRPDKRAIPPAGAPAAGQENKAPIRRLIASGIKRAKHYAPSALHGSYSNAKSRMNTGSREVEGSNSQPRTEVASPPQHAVPPATATKVKSHAAGGGNPRREAAQPQYHRGNTQYRAVDRAADRLVQRVGPSADVWFATRSGGVDVWLGHAGAKFDWPRINALATDTAIGAIAVGARAEGRDTTAGSADHPVATKATSGHKGAVAAHASGAGTAGNAGRTAAPAGPARAHAGRAAAPAAPPPTHAAPKRLAAKHAPPVRELSNSRLVLQIGVLLALVYLAFVICWLLARRSRHRFLRRGLHA
jgi:hypothetical protein